MTNYEVVIGLEVHLQAKTKSKMFCRCDANYFGSQPNSHVCPVCLGLPGALPVPNKVAIEKCLKLALALDCEINTYSKFDRKNYFYPDLPKGYQISQYDLPIGKEGYLEVDVNDDSNRIRIRRVHMEEDTGKSLHDEGKTLLDFNKSGIPLIEIVSEPDFVDVKEVTAYAKRLKQIVRYLDISDADMEKGQMRFELNMSLRPANSKDLPDYKVEVKNIGSISVLEKVVMFEFKRQAEILDRGEQPPQETRGLRDLTGETYSQRVKEGAEDYRYFPEPDIPPMEFDHAQIKAIKDQIGELPQAKKARYMQDYGLEANTAETILTTMAKSAWFEKSVESLTDKSNAKELAKWFIGDLFSMLKADKKKLKDLSFEPKALAELVDLLKGGKLSGTLAKQVLLEMYKSGKSAAEITADKGMEVIGDDDQLKAIAQEIIMKNAKVVADIDKNPNAIRFLVGQMMRETKGKADPIKSEQILKELLTKSVS